MLDDHSLVNLAADLLRFVILGFVFADYYPHASIVN